MILSRVIAGDAEFRWQDLAACTGMAEPRTVTADGVETVTDYFFDTYENDPGSREPTKALCMSCPVRQNCLIFALENKFSGLWGGEYLEDGTIK
jgi:Transcription factor WhiB